MMHDWHVVVLVASAIATTAGATEVPITIRPSTAIINPADTRSSQFAGPSDTSPAREPIRVGPTGSVGIPVASIQAALAQVRTLRANDPTHGIDILLPPGLTRLADAIVIGPNESGTPNAPLRILGSPDSRSIISGAAVIAGEISEKSFLTIDVSRALGRPASLEVSAYNRQTTTAANPMIFQGGWKIGLSAWPQNGYLEGWILKPMEGGALLTWPEGKAHPKLGPAVLVSGYIVAGWAFETVRGIPRADGVFLPHYKPGFLPKDPPRVRLLNLATPDATGSMTLEESSGKATVNPLNAAPLEIARIPSLFIIDHGSNVILEAVRLEKTTGAAVRIINSYNVTLDGCSIGQTGREAVSITDSSMVTIQHCVVRGTGGAGIVASGGDRTTLTPGNIVVSDSIIEQFGTEERAYRPGISLSGAGNRAEHNLIAAGPHNAVMLSGNDQVLDGNEIDAVACETSDVSAVYMGRDWTMRGIQITNNFIHDIGAAGVTSQPIGVYLDDQFSSAHISRNIFLRMTWGVLVGGGRDNRIDDNVFALMSGSAVHYDSRGLGNQSSGTPIGDTLRAKLAASPYQTPLWKRRYPTLATLLQNNPGAPSGNSGSGNLLVGSAWIRGADGGFPMTGTAAKIWAAPALLRAGPVRKVYDQLAALGRLTGPRPGPRGVLMFDRYRLASPNCNIVTP